MASNRYKGIGFQILLVLGGILFFFAVIGGMVRWIMPGGKQDLPIQANSEGSSGKLLDAKSAKLAILSYIDNDVKSKRANEIIWQPAILNMPLYERDSVQTLKRSNAVITFDDNNFLDVNQNSLVIIKKIDEAQIQPEKRSFLVIIDGDLKGQLEADKKSSVRLLVNTPTATTEVAMGKQSGDKSIFEISVKPDRTSKIKVLRGSARVRAQGEEVELKARQMTQVAVNKPPKAPVSLPKAVSLQKPADGANFFYVTFLPKVNFSWTPEPSAVKYHLEIAEDEQFRKMIFEKKVSGYTFLHDDLKQGHYYWRVRAVDRQGEDGEPSEVRQLEVAQKGQDTKSPIHVW